MIRKALTTEELSESVTGLSGRRAAILHLVNRYFLDCKTLKIRFDPDPRETYPWLELRQGVIVFEGSD